VERDTQMESIHQTQKNKCSEGEHIIMGKEEEVAVYRAHTRKEREKKNLVPLIRDRKGDGRIRA